MNTLMEKLLNHLSVDERITNGIFDISNNEHMDIMREYLLNKGIPKEHVYEFTNRVTEGGKYPDRQAYNKDGILVTFPSPQHKQNAIKRGTHFEKDPTKGHPNIFTNSETGEPKKPPGRPRKDDKSDDNADYTPPGEGGGQSITPTGDVSSLPASGTDTNDQEETGVDNSTTKVSSTPIEAPDVQPPKPEKEKAQDKAEIDRMIDSPSVTLGAEPILNPLSAEDDKKYITEARKLIEAALSVINKLDKK